MSNRRALSWIIVFCLLAFAGVGGIELVTEGDSNEQIEPNSTLNATVTRVVDGDTVKAKLSSGGRQTVRYIGVDTPESVKPGEPPQCFGKAASAANKQLVQGKRVRLRVGREARDRYGRLLAYVYLQPGGRFVNALLIERGFARTLAIPPNTALAARFSRLQHQARRARRGLWGAC